MVEQGPEVYGKYQLLELLARGGMAEVYKAKSYGVEGFEKILVIKRILPELSANPQFVDMFIDEAKIAVTLSHANVVQVFDLGRADDTYFIAMEYVAGSDLATVLRRGRRLGRALPIELAAFVVSEVAKGLDYAHRRRDASGRPLHIVHRDVSPQNVLISHEGEVKLTDFGIAKARTTMSAETQAGVLKGKYAYMSPEQAQGKLVDARTDIYALGIVLYEMLAGRNPFHADSAYETLKRVREGTAPRVHTVSRGIPEELSNIVARAMAPDPSKRHGNAGLLYEELVQFLYTSGRRTGAHDLASYLDALREASQIERIGEEPNAQLRATFDAVPRSPERTPVEKPGRAPLDASTTGGRRRRQTGSNERSTTTGVARPQAEKRDATAFMARLPARSKDEAGIRREIERWGGSLLEARVAGSGLHAATTVTALFGLSNPDGHDTDAAARCALALRRRLNVDCPIALHAGRLLVDLDGNLVREQRLEAILAAANDLLARTAAGTTTLGRTTEPLLRRAFDVRPIHGLEAVYRLVEARDFTETLGKFVGRRDELRRVGEVLADANRRRTRVLAIIGDEGAGKSRILLETMRRLKAARHDVGMHVARVDRNARNVPLAMCQEMLRVVLGVDDLDTEAEVREKVGRLRELGLPRPDIAAVELAMGLPLGGGPLPEGERSLRAAIARMATKLAQDRLTVFAFDGVENADDASMLMLERLTADTADSRVVIVVTQRPGPRRISPSVQGYEEITLSPFSDPDIAKMTAALLGADEVPTDLLRKVTLKSGGNPLYVEEYVRALQDAGAVALDGTGKTVFRTEIADVEVPKSLRGIVAARLSRLAPLDRQVIQIGAVAGHSFRTELLSHVADEEPTEVEVSLAGLQDRGIVVMAAPGEFRFAHDLIGIVTREGLPIEARRELHAAVAEAMERLYPQQLDEWADRVAHHFREGGRRDRAVHYFIRASQRLEVENRLDAAVGVLVTAAEMLSEQGERDERLSLLRRIGELCVRGRLVDLGEKHLESAIALAEAAMRDEQVAVFSMLRGQLLGRANRTEEGMQWLDRARSLARSVGKKELLRDVTLATAQAHTRIGDYATAIGLLRDAHKLARETGDGIATLRSMLPLAVAHAAAGDATRAQETLEAARRLLPTPEPPMLECEHLLAELQVAYYSGAPDDAIGVGLRALEVAKSHGFPFESALAALYVGECYLRLTDFKRAFAHLRYTFDIAREHRFTKLQYRALAILGFLDAVKFGSEDGRRRLLEAARYAEERGHVGDLVQALYLLAFLDEKQGEVAAAVRGFREVLRLSAEYRHGHYEHAAEMALIAIEQGKPVNLPR